MAGEVIGIVPAVGSNEQVSNRIERNRGETAVRIGGVGQNQARFAHGLPNRGREKRLCFRNWQRFTEHEKIDECVEAVAYFGFHRGAAGKSGKIQLLSGWDIEPLSEGRFIKAGAQKMLAEGGKLLRGDHLKRRHAQHSRTARA